MRKSEVESNCSIAYLPRTLKKPIFSVFSGAFRFPIINPNHYILLGGWWKYRIQKPREVHCVQQTFLISNTYAYAVLHNDGTAILKIVMYSNNS